MVKKVLAYWKQRAFDTLATTWKAGL
jgi:hypothetical protein